MKISVLTPTIRKNGLDIVRKALSNQSFIDFEWLIGSSFDPEISEARWIKDDFEGGYWSINRIYNKLFSQAKGELFISLQDWIWVRPDGLETFWNDYQATKGQGLITGVGDQYAGVNEFGKPTIKIWSDPRRTIKYGSFYEVNFQDIEYNWAALPKKLVYEVGGADEQLDFLGLGAEIFSIGDRLNDLGKKFYIDQTCESFTVRHGREDFGGEESWNSKNTFFNGKYVERKSELKQKGQWPHLAYLSSD